MRPLMPPVQTPDNLFHDGNPLTGELGTIVDAEHLNNEQAAIRDTQSELIAILTAAAMEPESTAGQLLAALNKLYAPLNDTLGALSSLVGGANKLPYFTSANAAALTALSSIGRDIVGKATVADVLTYLGLKTAAQRDVGTGTNQLPDMSAFTSVKANPGYQKLPSGLIIQWGSAVTGADGSIFAIYPTTFPNQVLASFCTNLGEFPTGQVAASTPSLVSIRLSCIANSSGTGAPGVSVSYFVVGY